MVLIRHFFACTAKQLKTSMHTTLTVLVCLAFTAQVQAKSTIHMTTPLGNSSSPGYEKTRGASLDSSSKTASTAAEKNRLVLVVSINNPINTLTKKEIIDIYMGRYKTFPDSRYAQAIDYPAGSKIKQRFYLQLVDRSERKINAYWSRLLFSGRATPPASTNSPEEVASELINNPNGLAYMPEHAVTPEMKIVYRL